MRTAIILAGHQRKSKQTGQETCSRSLHWQEVQTTGRQPGPFASAYCLSTKAKRTCIKHHPILPERVGKCKCLQGQAATRGWCLLWAEWDLGGTGGHTLYIRAVVGAACLQMIGREGPGPLWAEAQISEVRGQTSRLLRASSWFLETWAAPGKGSIPVSPPPQEALTFPPDHQGQLPCVGLPAGFDEHHHLVMGVF